MNLYTANIMTQILEKKTIQGDEKQSACGPAGQAGAAAMALMSHIHLAQVCEASMHPLNLVSYLV